MRSTLTIGIALLLTLGFVTVATPQAEAFPFCHDVLCCKNLEPAAATFARCVACVAIGGVWDVGTDQCLIP